MNWTHNKAGPIQALQNSFRGTYLAYFNINAIPHILLKEG